MSNKRFTELKNLSLDELGVKLRETEKNIFEVRMKLQTGQEKNHASVWRLRKDIARIKTLQTQLQRTGEVAQSKVVKN